MTGYLIFAVCLVVCAHTSYNSGYTRGRYDAFKKVEAALDKAGVPK